MHIKPSGNKRLRLFVRCPKARLRSPNEVTADYATHRNIAGTDEQSIFVSREVTLLYTRHKTLLEQATTEIFASYH